MYTVTVNPVWKKMYKKLNIDTSQQDSNRENPNAAKGKTLLFFAALFDDYPI
jgi:hypothetical protein